MRGVRLEEKFAIFGIILVLLFSIAIIIEASIEVRYSPIVLNSSADSSDRSYGFFDMIREFFVSLSEEVWGNYIIYILAVVLILLIFFLIKIKHRVKNLEKKEKLIYDAKVFVQQLRDGRYNDSFIRQMFVEKGWKQEEIDLIMK